LQGCFLPGGVFDFCDGGFELAVEAFADEGFESACELLAGE
jgi:hypothetical protein